MATSRGPCALCLFLWTLTVGLGGPGPAQAAEGERELRYFVPYIRRRDLPVTLGPTGAHGHVVRHWIVVKGSPPGSPAEKLLRLGDTVAVVNGADFVEGSAPRMAVGRAVTEAEAGRALKLDILRDGKRQRIAILLRPPGACFSLFWSPRAVSFASREELR